MLALTVMANKIKNKQILNVRYINFNEKKIDLKYADVPFVLHLSV